MAEMTREEAAKILYQEKSSAGWMRWVGFPIDIKKEQEYKRFILAVNVALDALRGPQPDPDTGLVPCGCGGALKVERFNDGCFDLERIACECGIEITSGPGFCKPAWNRAMGWREKE